MKKDEYLNRLNKALYGIPHEEAVRLVEYYRELIEDGIENRDEEEFISKLEPPELVAENYRKEEKTENSKFSYEEKEEQNKSSKPKEKNVPFIFRLILIFIGAVFAFSGAIGLFVTGIITFAFIIYGVYTFIAAFALLFSYPAVAFAQMGYALILGTLGLASGYIFPFLCKGFVFIIKSLCLKKATFKKPYIKKKAFYGFGAIFAIGVLTFAISFGSMGFNVAKLTRTDDMNLVEKTMEMPVDSFTIISENLGLDIRYTDDENIKLQYYDFESTPKTFTYDNGKVSLTSKDPMGTFGWIWKRGVFFTMFSGKYYDATLYLPRSTVLDFTIEIDNGKIAIDQIEFNDLKLSTSNGAIDLNHIKANDVKLSTSNGAIDVKNSEINSLTATADNGAISLKDSKITDTVIAKTQNGLVELKNVSSKSLICESNNGMIKVENCQSEIMSGETDNGAINVYRLQANNIDLSTGNGSINGTILGDRNDYRIDARTGAGTNNLSNKDYGDKLLKVRTGNGSINLSFIQ